MFKKRFNKGWKRRRVVNRKRLASTTTLPPAKRRRMQRRALDKAIVPRTIGTLFPTKVVFYHRFEGFKNVGHETGITYMNPAYLDSIMIRPNSVYDPCFSTLTTMDKSVDMYDYFARFYGRYSVKWCVAHFSLYQLDSASAYQNGARYGFGVKVDNDGTVGPTLTYDMARTSKQWKCKTFVSKGDYTLGYATIKVLWSEKMMDVNDRKDNAAAPGYNPTGAATYYMVPALGSFNGQATNTDNLTLKVRLYMKVEWSDKKDLDSDGLLIPQESME